mmetsp:Transcript_41339/g.46106  ORF Transcript_41339/g.46106 Transcript_41339/m.46106 type:complete len:137 (+) Transcript_41339:393-803(+)
MFQKEGSCVEIAASASVSGSSFTRNNNKYTTTTVSEKRKLNDKRRQYNNTTSDKRKRNEKRSRCSKGTMPLLGVPQLPSHKNKKFWMCPSGTRIVENYDNVLPPIFSIVLVLLLLLLLLLLHLLTKTRTRRLLVQQ